MSLYFVSLNSNTNLSSFSENMAYSNMDEINRQILDTVDNRTIRIVADVPTDLLRSEDFVISASDLIMPFRKQWETKNMTRLLAVDVYSHHAYIVIDINNLQYDYETAHNQTSPIPVYILRLSRSNKWSFFRRATDDQKIATSIAELHKCNGQNPLPFFADHIKGSVYLSPRTT